MKDTFSNRFPIVEAEEERSFCSFKDFHNVDRHFVADGQNSFWTLCVFSDDSTKRSGKTASRKASVDYRDILNPEEFALYDRLRELRKQLADRDGVPTYAVFTTEQLAAIVQRRASSLTKLREIDGIGEARVANGATHITRWRPRSARTWGCRVAR